GGAFFGFLSRVGQEAAAKSDLPDAIAIAGSLQDRLQAEGGLVPRIAPEVGAVRGDIRTPDLVVLLKGLLASIQDAQEGAADPARRDRLLAVVSDGLRGPPERAAGTGTPQSR